MLISKLLFASKSSLSYTVLTLTNLQLKGLRQTTKCHFTGNCWHASYLSECQFFSLLSGGRSTAHIISLILSPPLFLLLFLIEVLWQVFTCKCMWDYLKSQNLDCWVSNSCFGCRKYWKTRYHNNHSKRMDV